MKFLHTMIRVGNLEKSIKFYTDVLEMKILRTKDYPEGKFTLVFMSYGNEVDHHAIELTYNYGVEKYELGTGFGHIAIAVTDINQICDRVKNLGYKVTKEPSPMKFGGVRNIAFIEDPDGYKIELIEEK